MWEPFSYAKEKAGYTGSFLFLKTKQNGRNVEIDEY